MSIATTCPNCEAFFRLSDTLAGKRVQCQKCMARFIVPSAGTTDTQPGIPVESISTSPPAKAPSARPKKPAPAPTVPDEPEEVDVEEVEERPRRKKRDETEDDEERPRRKKRDDTEDEGDDDRPRRKRRDEDEDEDDERPRRRKKKSRASSGSKSPMILMIGGACAVLLLCCVGGGGAVWLGGRNADLNQAGTTVVFGPDNVFRSEGALRLWDPTKDRRHFRLYTMQVEPGKTYEIDMTSRNLDAYLVLLDENNQVVAEDDDSGGNLNARLIYRSQRAGNFRIEASTFDDHETGSFTLVVRRR